MELKAEYTCETYARPCQTYALDSARNNKNQSAIIVLPCGAGKTYTGIAQLCRDVQDALVNAPANGMINFLVAAPIIAHLNGWREEIRRYTTISEKSTVTITGKDITLRNTPGPVRIFFITFSLLRTSRNHSGTVVGQLKRLRFYRIICDECHHVPGEKTYQMLFGMKTNGLQRCCKWTGLTASPINSSDKDCEKMIQLLGNQVDGGMSWKEMQRQQYIAPLCLKNVLCPFPKAWHDVYETLLHNKMAKDRNVLMRRMELFNPMKLAYIESLANRAIEQGHKFILFCDTVQLLREMARVMECKYIDGTTPETERDRSFDELRNGERRMLLVSRIADTGINFPDVDWAGQIDALCGSQRQKTQRVGRVLRFKQDKNASFWDVVTTHPNHDTQEEIFLQDRDTFLIQQDYVIKEEVMRLTDINTASPFLAAEEQATLLNMVNVYPHIKRECKEIVDDYKKQMQALKKPPKPGMWMSGANRPKCPEINQLAKRNYTGLMKKFEENRRTLRENRDRRLELVKAFDLLEECEFDDSSIDEENDLYDDCSDDDDGNMSRKKAKTSEAVDSYDDS